MPKKFMMYIIGISGSGKTTIANALEKEIKKRIPDYKLQVIDGDVIRSQFGDVFGYTYEERMKCNRTVRVVVQYLIDNNISVVLSQVAAYEEMRRNMRGQFAPDYIEIYVKCSVEECERRDVKGYYQKLRNGEMENLNGSNDLFEIPNNSDIVIDTEKQTVEESVSTIIGFLKDKGYGI